jgi:hypothetical protein
MKDIINQLDDVGFLNAKDFEPSKSHKEPTFEESIKELESEGLLPEYYLKCLQLLSSPEVRKTALLKLRQIYLYAKTNAGSELQLKRFFDRGRIPEPRPAGVFSMTQLKAASNAFLKNLEGETKEREKIAEAEKCLIDKPDDQRAISKSEKAEERVQKVSALKKQHEEEFIELLHAISIALGSGKSA